MTTSDRERVLIVDERGVGASYIATLAALSSVSAVFAGVDLMARDVADLEILTLEERLAGIKSKIAADRALEQSLAPRNRHERRAAESRRRRRK